MKLKIIFSLFIITPIILLSQNEQEIKLVVGIVVDQMRFDYLERFYDDFGDGGFKRLINGGSHFTDCKINYIPTVTGAGHASIYTGTTPYFHGIIANDWKDRNSLENINCTSSIDPPDKKMNDGISRNRSPEQLFSTTIGDQIKLSNNGLSKVISISLKDRGSMLPAGKSADGAFWYDDENGRFISSFYYYDRLPGWVTEFNNSGIIGSYLSKDWTLLKEEEIYSDLPNDDSPYEKDVFKEGRTSFPHSFKAVKKEERFEKLAHTPYGDQIILDFVKEALANENLGKGKYTDHLAISFSSPDKIGHDYGPQSYEVKDTYLRLDLKIEELLNMLDSHVGQGNYILFLTADHGVMENTLHLRDLKIDSGNLDEKELYKGLDSLLFNKYGTKELIRTSFKRNIYLDYDEIESHNLERAEVEKTAKDFMIINFPEIEAVYIRSELELMTASRENNNFLLNGFNNKRSGDIIYSLKSNYLHSERLQGSTHGSGHSYDNHIPLIFYGKGIPAEIRTDKVFITDIAATVTDLIGVTKPSDSIGKVLINP